MQRIRHVAGVITAGLVLVPLAGATAGATDTTVATTAATTTATTAAPATSTAAPATTATAVNSTMATATTAAATTTTKAAATTVAATTTTKAVATTIAAATTTTKAASTTIAATTTTKATATTTASATTTTKPVTTTAAGSSTSVATSVVPATTTPAVTTTAPKGGGTTPPTGQTADPTVVFTAPVIAGDGTVPVVFTGDVATIEWTTTNGAGTEKDGVLEIDKGSTKVVTVATGVDVTTKRFRWSIPANIAALKDSGLTLKFTSATTPADNATSDAFDVVAPSVSDVNLVADATATTPVPVTSAVVGASYDVTWMQHGFIGEKVKIDLVRTVGSKVTTVTLNKAADNTGHAHVTIPEKTVVDGTDGTYKLIVTGASTAATAGKSAAAFKVVGRSLTIDEPSTDVSVAAGEAVPITWTSSGALGKIKIEAVPTAAKAKTITIDAGTTDDGTYTWYPSAAVSGEYSIKISSATVKDATSTATGKVTIGAPMLFTLDDLSLTSAVNGQPVDIMWSFQADANATVFADDLAPVDITLLDANGKKLSVIATGVTGTADPSTHEVSYTWVPDGKVKAANYKIKVNVSGTTDADHTGTKPIAIAAPTDLTLDAPTDTGAAAGSQVLVAWTITGDSLEPVTIDLVDSKGKATNLVKSVSSVGHQALVTIPAKTAAASYTLKVSTVDKLGGAALSDSMAFAITEPVLNTVTGEATIVNGAPTTITWDFVTAAPLPVKLELYHSGHADKDKAVLTIAASAPTTSGTGSYTWTPDFKLAAGAYVVKATVIGTATAVTMESDDINVAAPVLDIFGESVASGVHAGEAVMIDWSLSADASNTVSVFLVKSSGNKEKATKLTATAGTSHGVGGFLWIVDPKLAAGTDYSIRVTDNTQKTLTAETPAFTVTAAAK